MEEKPLHLKQTLTMMDTCQEQVHLCLCHSCIIYSAYEYVLYLCFTVSFFFYDSNMSESFLQGTMSAGLSSSGTTFGCFSVTSVHHGGVLLWLGVFRAAGVSMTTVFLKPEWSKIRTSIFKRKRSSQNLTEMAQKTLAFNWNEKGSRRSFLAITPLPFKTDLGESVNQSI